MKEGSILMRDVFIDKNLVGTFSEEECPVVQKGCTYLINNGFTHVDSNLFAKGKDLYRVVDWKEMILY